jgi:hypothetical protein
MHFLVIVTTILGLEFAFLIPSAPVPIALAPIALARTGEAGHPATLAPNQTLPADHDVPPWSPATQGPSTPDSSDDQRDEGSDESPGDTEEALESIDWIGSTSSRRSSGRSLRRAMPVELAGVSESASPLDRIRLLVRTPLSTPPVSLTTRLCRLTC